MILFLRGALWGYRHARATGWPLIESLSFALSAGRVFRWLPLSTLVPAAPKGNQWTS